MLISAHTLKIILLWFAYYTATQLNQKAVWKRAAITSINRPLEPQVFVNVQKWLYLTSKDKQTPKYSQYMGNSALIQNTSPDFCKIFGLE